MYCIHVFFRFLMPKTRDFCSKKLVDEKIRDGPRKKNILFCTSPKLLVCKDFLSPLFGGNVIHPIVFLYVIQIVYSLRPADGKKYHHVYSGFVWKSCSAKIPGAWRGTQKACRQLSLAAPPPAPLPPPSSQACNALVPEKKLRKFA